MPTTPLNSALVTNLKSATAWRFSSKLGPVYSPRFFCCTDPNSLGISEGKEPVAIIDLDPNPVLTGVTVNYDGTDSYDPDGSVTGYAWTFEGHTPSSGTASSGTLSYASPGTFTVQLVVTDGTGLTSLPARQELVVVEPATGGYIATTNGVYYSGGTAPLTWTDKNIGLSGDQLESYAVAIDPATQASPEANKVIWRANQGSVMVSTDGGATWTDKTPGSLTNTWSDTTPTAGTAQVSVATGADDGWISDTGAFNNSNPTAIIGKTSPSGFAASAWTRFETSIPQGATAGTAYISLTPDASRAGTVCRLVIYGEDADAPAAPTSAADYNGRTRTGGSVTWEPAAWTAGTVVQSPDLTSIIDELAARGGFGGTVQIFIQDDGSDGSALRDFVTYDGSPASAPELYVEYTYDAAPAAALLTYRDLHFMDDRLFTVGTWQNGSGEWRSWIFYTDNPANVRTEGTAATVTWSEL